MLAEQIQRMRKSRGLSQEELADKIGVSRQAVSKWESGQSQPDIDRLLALSDFFAVSVDTLLKGSEGKEEQQQSHPMIWVAAATAANAAGVLIGCASWSSTQQTGSLIAGLILLILGVMIYAIGLFQCPDPQRKRMKVKFWKINVWLVCFMPMALFYNIAFQGIPAPYPLLNANTFIPFLLFWLVYLITGMAVMMTQIRKEKQHGW